MNMPQTLIHGTNGQDTISGTAGDDIIVGFDGDDTLRGLAGADILLGDVGNDQLQGGDGDDLLSGHLGANTLNGGAGADTADYRFASGGAIVNLGAGTATNTGATFNDTLSAIENVVGGDGADTLTGDGGDNVLTGGYGADAINGGGGNDTASYVDSAEAVTINLGTGAGLGGQAQGDTLTSIEIVVGSALGDTLEGGGSADTLRGGLGRDGIYGFGGNDVIQGGDETGDGDILAGGAGEDQVFGGAGHDVIYGEAGADQLFGEAGVDLLYVDAQDTLVSGGADADYLAVADVAGGSWSATDIENWIGHNGADTFTVTGAAMLVYMQGFGGADTLLGGNAGDYLFGGDGGDLIAGSGGNDNLYGGAGADSLFGDDGSDILYFDGLDTTVEGNAGYDYAVAQDDGGVSLNLASGAIEYAVGGAGADTLSALGAAFGVEVYGGGGADLITGGNSNDILSGGDANDIVAGGDGQDYLIGGAGADRLFGDAGGDTIYFDSFDTAVEGNAGFDTAIAQDNGGVSLDLTAGAIEVAIGAAGSDTLSAQGASWTVQVYGLDGADTLISGSGTVGTAGYLYGGSGDDVLVSGSRSDIFFGGADADTFRMTDDPFDDSDYIYDWQDGVDKIDLSLIPGISGMGDIQLSTYAGTWLRVDYGNGLLWINNAIGQIEASDFFF
jgi:Ca2+-binding RTX toxin-like protein